MKTNYQNSNLSFLLTQLKSFFTGFTCKMDLIPVRVEHNNQVFAEKYKI